MGCGQGAAKVVALGGPPLLPPAFLQGKGHWHHLKEGSVCGVIDSTQHPHITVVMFWLYARHATQ